jgi:predicted nucleotidyltransferase
MRVLFPTQNHKEYITYMTDICHAKHFSLLLEGSLAKGTAKEFSDIDLAVCGDIKEKDLDDIIKNYDELVMTNYTENPKGIIILNYKNGISIDLDIRETVTQEELDCGVLLSDFGFLVSQTVIREQMKSQYLPDRPQWYKTIRLIHRGCIKYLCKKSAAADGLNQEIAVAVNQCCKKNPKYQNEIKYDLMAAFQAICNEYTVDQNVILLFENLFDNMK